MRAGKFFGFWSLAIVSCFPVARADVLIYSDTEDMQPTSVAFNIPAFDPRLGTLNSAGVEALLTVTGSLDFTNLSAQSCWISADMLQYIVLTCDQRHSPFVVEFYFMQTPGAHVPIPVDGNAEYHQSWADNITVIRPAPTTVVTGTGYPYFGWIIVDRHVSSGCTNNASSVSFAVTAALTVTYDYTPRPTLGLRLAADGTVTLSWATNAPGYTLERGTNYTGTFVTVTNVPLAAGTNWVVNLPAARPTEFFRLRF